MASSKQEDISSVLNSQTDEEISFKEGAEGGAKELSSVVIVSTTTKAMPDICDKWDIVLKQLEVETTAETKASQLKNLVPCRRTSCGK